MKRVLFLTLVALLVSSLSVMASDVTFSGETMLTFWTDMETEYLEDGDAELIVTAVVDDYNTAKLDIEAGHENVADDLRTGDALQIDEAYFTTEWGKYLGTEDMGITITTYWGYNEWMNAQTGEITEYGEEEVYDFDDENWSVNIDVGIMDVVHIEYAVSPDPADLNTIIGLYGGMDPIHAEVYFAREGEEYDKGELGLAVAFGMDIMPGMFGLEVAASFLYDIDSDIDVDADDGILKYAYGVGVATDIMDGTAYVDLGVLGWDDSMLFIAFAAVGVNYEDMVGFDVGVGLTLDSDFYDEVFDELDLYVWTKAGAAKFGVGYLRHADQGAIGNYFSGLRCPDADLCDPAVVENGVVYFSGELDF
jgi:hypothetical protein